MWNRPFSLLNWLIIYGTPSDRYDKTQSPVSSTPIQTSVFAAFLTEREPLCPGPQKALSIAIRERWVKSSSILEKNSLAWSDTHPLGSIVLHPSDAGKTCSRLL